MGGAGHLPVLYEAVLEYLQPRPDGVYVDCTVGAGGHAAGLLERSAPDGRLLGLDADPQSLEQARQRLHAFRGRAQLVHANFRDLAQVARSANFSSCHGVLFDLGLSSLALERSGRGFSFRSDEPLDMRFDPSAGPTAADLLNQAWRAELERIFREFGEEPRASRLALSIVQQRDRAPLLRTSDLLGATSRVLGPRRGRLNPATRLFQALRIAVNDELEALREALPQALDLLRPGGRIAVIAFHSLEDRIVKTSFRERAAGPQPQLRILTAKPLTASREELRANPRARSAKLRVAERL